MPYEQKEDKASVATKNEVWADELSAVGRTRIYAGIRPQKSAASALSPHRAHTGADIHADDVVGEHLRLRT